MVVERGVREQAAPTAREEEPRDMQHYDDGRERAADDGEARRVQVRAPVARRQRKQARRATQQRGRHREGRGGATGRARAT